MFVDWATNSNAFKDEIYFVGIRELPEPPFGGRLEEVKDPVTGMIVTPSRSAITRARDRRAQAISLVGTFDVTKQRPGNRLVPSRC